MMRLLCLLLLVEGTALMGADVKVPGRSPDKIQALILTGYNMHDWRKITPGLRELLESTGKFEVRVNEEPVGITEATLTGYDLIVLNYTNHLLRFGPTWPENTREALLRFVRGGKGVVVFHGSLSAFPEWPEYEVMTGGAWRKGAAHAPYHAFKGDFKDREHPITKGLSASFQQVDEVDQGMTMQPDIDVLATAYDDPDNCTSGANKLCGSGKHQPIIWSLQYGSGRVFTTTLGHDMKSISTPGFIATFQRGAEWAATGKVTIPPPPEVAATPR